MTSSGFTVSSPDLQEGHFMAKDHEFDGFGCNGKNVSPELNWLHAPAGTKSFAVTSLLYGLCQMMSLGCQMVPVPQWLALCYTRMRWLRLP
jgi:hypothetical protein